MSIFSTKQLALLLRLLPLLAALHSFPAEGREYLLRPDDASGAGLPASQMNWEAVAPGDVITLQGGTYVGSLDISLQGTAQAPIILGAENGQTPVIRGSLTLFRSAWVTVQGLTIQNTNQAGIAIRDGSHNLTVRNNVIRNTGLGIWIGAGAGGNHLIEYNAIGPNQTHGIAIDKVNLRPGTETIIRGNRVFDNRHHGIEINGSGYVVERNEVFRNGGGLPGTSGIHCFAKDAGEGTGRYNIIRYNVSWGQKDRAGPDGNGIQLDRWCDHNQVYHNIAYDNDGAGIHVFHAAHNEIHNNTLLRNMKDVEHSHEPELKGDLVVVNDRDRSPRTEEVRIANNLIVSRYSSVLPVVLDAITATKVRFDSNQFYHEDGSSRVRMGNQDVADVEELNLRAPGSMGNWFASPKFKAASPIWPGDFGPNSRNNGSTSESAVGAQLR
jgi:parallel beta-helix repeat protein